MHGGCSVISVILGHIHIGKAGGSLSFTCVCVPGNIDRSSGL